MNYAGTKTEKNLEAAFAGEGEESYKAICDDLNAAWAASRDAILG